MKRRTIQLVQHVVVFAQKLKSDFNLSNEDLRKHFSCLILLLLNLTSKPFNLKYSTLYFSPIQSCSRLGIGPITCALSANRNQKRSNTFFMTVLIRIYSGKMLNYIYFVLRKQQVHLTLKDILIGILTSESSLLNYLVRFPMHVLFSLFYIYI